MVSDLKIIFIIQNYESKLFIEFGRIQSFPQRFFLFLQALKINKTQGAQRR